jgi:putative nucleotidyltransferase with HDIG domain
VDEALAAISALKAGRAPADAYCWGGSGMESTGQDNVRKYFRYVVDNHKLPSLPLVAGKVLEMIQDPDLNVQKLCRVLSDDTALSGRVLAVARSPHYAQRNVPTTLVGAVQVLGFRTLSNVVVASATHSLCIKGNKVSEKLWNHSLGVALATRLLCRRAGLRNEEQAFLAGLMHDVGEMILVHGDPRGFEQLVHKVEEGQCEIIAKEQEVYGFDHTLIGVTLLDAWNIDSEIRHAVLQHHAYGAPDDPKSMAASLRCADYLSAKADLGFFSALPAPDAGAMSAIGCDSAEEMANVVTQIRQAYEDESALFRPL